MQAEVTSVEVERTSGGRMRVCGVTCRPGGYMSARAVIISTGTYLGGLCHIETYTPAPVRTECSPPKG